MPAYVRLLLVLVLVFVGAASYFVANMVFLAGVFSFAAVIGEWTPGESWGMPTLLVQVVLVRGY